MTRDPLIGFAGLGNLGHAMSLNLIDKGWALKVLDRRSERVKLLTDSGAEEVGPSGLADADVICFAVPDAAAIRAILADGLIERLTPRHTILVHSTILPDHARELAARIEGENGARYLDVPVSGGAERARRGKLTLLIGGEIQDITIAKPVLDDLGTSSFHLGPVGAGSATKLANQLIMFAALAGVHEALQITRAAGVGDMAALEAIETGTGDTWVGRNWGFFDRVVADYNSAGVAVTDRPWSKDLSELVSAGRDAGLSLPVAELLAHTLADVVEIHAKAGTESKGKER